MTSIIIYILVNTIKYKQVLSSTNDCLLQISITLLHIYPYILTIPILAHVMSYILIKFCFTCFTFYCMSQHLILWKCLRASWILCNILKYSCFIWYTLSIRDYPAHSLFIICWWWRYTAVPELQISRGYGKQTSRPLSLSLGSPLPPQPSLPTPQCAVG